MRRLTGLQNVFVRSVFLVYVIGSASFIGCTTLSGQDNNTTTEHDYRVMLQGFYWDAYRHGHTDMYPEIMPGRGNIDQYWYEIVRQKANEIQTGQFDMIWLPPPSAASGMAGYGPKQLFKLNNMYGDSTMHVGLLEALNSKGIQPIADVVINHRNGTKQWTDFTQPDWPTSTICNTDEAFTTPASEAYNSPDDERGHNEEMVPYDNSRVRAFAYDAYRDIDHDNQVVQKGIEDYLKLLQTVGYKGWRYDMVHGYHAKHIAHYNQFSHPTFSVGEYDWGQHDASRGWIYNTAFTETGISTSSSVFDFKTFFTLRDNKSNYVAWYGYGQGIGLIGDNTDGLEWKTKAVTFLENHDTGYRCMDKYENGELHLEPEGSNSFENNWEVEQGYAYILTHPGIPCVYWPHYFDWGDDLHAKINALIIARKKAGVHAASHLYTQDNAKQNGVYGVKVQGDKASLYVRVGGNDDQWNPSQSGYGNTIAIAEGIGWKVWIDNQNNVISEVLDHGKAN